MKDFYFLSCQILIPFFKKGMINPTLIKINGFPFHISEVKKKELIDCTWSTNERKVSRSKRTKTGNFNNKKKIKIKRCCLKNSPSVIFRYRLELRFLYDK